MDVKCYNSFFLLITVFLLSLSDLSQQKKEQELVRAANHKNWYKYRHHAEILIGNCIALRCGGVIIHCSHILTAADCVSVFGIPLPPQILSVQAYVKDMRDKHFRFNVTNVYMHPNFQRYPLMHNLAILKITPKMTYSDKLLLADLPKSLKKDGKGITTGVGANIAIDCQNPLNFFLNLSINTYVREYESTITSCDDYSDFIVPVSIKENVFCTPPTKSFSLDQPCDGDVGGPFVTYHGQRTTLHGIVSAGTYCPFSPTAYTYVFPYKKWIQDIIKHH